MLALEYFGKFLGLIGPQEEVDDELLALRHIDSHILLAGVIAAVGVFAAF